jgi:putative Mg2+ transporter-C (MgtC) family protein
MFDFELVSIGRLLLAVVLGGLVGLERQIHGRPAGLRTHVLVCLGSALILVVTQSLGPDVDPGRAVAGIVTGVGFLGAGVIVKSKEIVRGLTTAACIWFVAALGIAIGQGLYVIAVASTAISIIVLTLLAWFAHRISSVSYDCVHVGGRASNLDVIEAKCREELTRSGFRVTGLYTRLDKQADSAALTIRLRTRRVGKASDPSRRLIAIPEVNNVSWGE